VLTRRDRAIVALQPVPAALTWLGTNASVEGPVLLALGHGHGFTAADLLVALPLAACASGMRQLLRRKRT
jgi:hypothetical protein